jgi:hypothetical protein
MLYGVLSVMSLSASGQAVPCSWPLETTGSGFTNFAYPDTNATYWIMPLNSKRWKSIVINGTYPQARYFSFIPYVAQGAVVNNQALKDIDIDPAEGNSDPFRQNESDTGTHLYTITASRNAPSGGATNFLQLGETRLAWILYRIYVPNKNLERNAGVPLPSITLIGQDDRPHALAPCHANTAAGRLANLTQALVSQGLDVTASFQATATSTAIPTILPQASCQATPLLSLIPANTGGYFPNPDNKYIAVPGLCFHADRVVVVRGKGAVFPDTFNGDPIWEPPGVLLRYWSMCNNNERAPFPVVACGADYKTNLDKQGYYTYVVSEAERNDVKTPPSWVPPDATWLPWGARTTPNVLIFRNMLPNASFKHSVQAAIDKGCVVDNGNGNSPSRAEQRKAAACAQRVMRAYYPRAVYCEKQILINEGWQGCFAAAAGEKQ